MTILTKEELIAGLKKQGENHFELHDLVGDTNNVIIYPDNNAFNRIFRKDRFGILGTILVRCSDGVFAIPFNEYNYSKGAEQLILERITPVSKEDFVWILEEVTKEQQKKLENLYTFKATLS